MSACPQCGNVAKPTDKFCNVCGTPIARTGAPAAPPGPAYIHSPRRRPSRPLPVPAAAVSLAYRRASERPPYPRPVARWGTTSHPAPATARTDIRSPWIKCSLPAMPTAAVRGTRLRVRKVTRSPRPKIVLTELPRYPPPAHRTALTLGIRPKLLSALRPQCLATLRPRRAFHRLAHSPSSRKDPPATAPRGPPRHTAGPSRRCPPKSSAAFSWLMGRTRRASSGHLRAVA